MTDGPTHPLLPSSALLALDAPESRRDAWRLRAVLEESAMKRTRIQVYQYDHKRQRYVRVWIVRYV